MPFNCRQFRTATLRIPQVWRSFEYEKTHPHVVAAVVKTLEEIYQYGGLQRGSRSSGVRKAACNLIALATGAQRGRKDPQAISILKQAIRRRCDPEPEIRIPLEMLAPRP